VYSCFFIVFCLNFSIVPEGGSVEFKVRENLAGALVGNLLKTQANLPKNGTSWWKSLRFIIANQQDVVDKFAISADGSIYTLQPLDREERDIYRLIVLTENSKGVLKGAGIYQVPNGKKNTYKKRELSWKKCLVNVSRGQVIQHKHL